MIEPELFTFKPTLNKHQYVNKKWDKLFTDIDKYGLTHSVSILFYCSVIIYIIIMS